MTASDYVFPHFFFFLVPTLGPLVIEMRLLTSVVGKSLDLLFNTDQGRVFIESALPTSISWHSIFTMARRAGPIAVLRIVAHGIVYLALPSPIIRSADYLRLERLPQQPDSLDLAG